MVGRNLLFSGYYFLKEVKENKRCRLHSRKTLTTQTSFNNADKFVRLCSAYAEDIDLFANGKYIVNAKSSLGVASCAGYDDLEVNIKTNDAKLADKFYDAVKQAGFAKR